MNTSNEKNDPLTSSVPAKVSLKGFTVSRVPTYGVRGFYFWSSMEKIYISRKRINNQTWFEVKNGPHKLNGILLDYPALKFLYDSGVEVNDLDAIRAEMVLTN